MQTTLILALSLLTQTFVLAVSSPPPPERATTDSSFYIPESSAELSPADPVIMLPAASERPRRLPIERPIQPGKVIAIGVSTTF